MYFEERLVFILDKLNKENSVSVSELAELLNVSEVTVRKDLASLEEKNLLKRTYGGALKIKDHADEIPIDRKITSMIEEKQKIVDVAENFLSDNLNIFLDAGTTTQGLVPKLKNYKNIKVITYDLDIASALARNKEVNTFFLGGLIDFNTRTSLGIDGLNSLKNFHADISFIGTDAFDEKNVYSTSDLKSKIKRLMLENSEKKILLSDSSKYSKTSIFSFYNIRDFDYIITDDKNEELNALIEGGGYGNFINKL